MKWNTTEYRPNSENDCLYWNYSNVDIILKMMFAGKIEFISYIVLKTLSVESNVRTVKCKNCKYSYFITLRAIDVYFII